MAETRSRINCLACGNRADELEEHHLHMARASHRDKGETWVRPNSSLGLQVGGSTIYLFILKRI